MGKTPVKALEFRAKMGSAAAYKNRKAVLFTVPDVIKFNHPAEGLYQRKFVKLKYTKQFYCRKKVGY